MESNKIDMEEFKALEKLICYELKRFVGDIIKMRSIYNFIKHYK